MVSRRLKRIIEVVKDEETEAKIELARALGPRQGMIGEVREEVRWIFQGRKGWIIGIVFNLVVATVYTIYEHYHPHSRDVIHINGLATQIAAWVMADVITTNQLLADPHRVLARIERGDSVTSILAHKSLALAVLLAPFAFIVSTGARLAIDRWREIPHAIMLDIWVVFTYLGIGCLVSVLLPYRPIPLKERWQRRREWRTTVFRWAVCLSIPYGMYYFVHDVMSIPPDKITRWLLGLRDVHRHQREWSFTFMCWGLIIWLVCLLGVNAYARRWPERLDRDLRRSD